MHVGLSAVNKRSAVTVKFIDDANITTFHMKRKSITFKEYSRCQTLTWWDRLRLLVLNRRLGVDPISWQSPICWGSDCGPLPSSGGAVTGSGGGGVPLSSSSIFEMAEESQVSNIPLVQLLPPIRKLSSKSNDWLWFVLKDSDRAKELWKYGHGANVENSNPPPLLGSTFGMRTSLLCKRVSMARDSRADIFTILIFTIFRDPLVFYSLPIWTVGNTI